MKIRRALISVSDKKGVVSFAKVLRSLDIEILSTGGTAKALRDGDVKVTDVSEYTDSPEILNGRLKTLHPKIHGGILAIRENKDHQREIEKEGIGYIDMVVVNLYPFEETVAKEGVTLKDAIENIDIGGPTMVRSAAKNYKDVAVLVDPNDYERIGERLKETHGELDEDLLFELSKKAFGHTACYDSAICSYLTSLDESVKREFPDILKLNLKKRQNLRYGENPHQRAAFFCEDNCPQLSISGAEQLHGKELSYNNIMDSDAAIEIVNEFKDDYFVAILKHTNPCGAALSKRSLVDAFMMARESDPVSSFGGIIGVNSKLDEKTAELIAETFFEVVIAPDYSNEALGILTKKKNIRLLKVPNLGSTSLKSDWNMRKVVGGMLVQERDLLSDDISHADVKTKRLPTEEERNALSFAWRICKHVKSNAIVYTNENQILGVGAGQMSRVDAAKIAHMKMEEMMKERTRSLDDIIVCASDAFFPFRDGIDAAARAGATAVIEPGGSKRDAEVIEAADEYKMAMIFTGRRHFKH